MNLFATIRVGARSVFCVLHADTFLCAENPNRELRFAARSGRSDGLSVGNGQNSEPATITGREQRERLGGVSNAAGMLRLGQFWLRDPKRDRGGALGLEIRSCNTSGQCGCPYAWCLALQLHSITIAIEAKKRHKIFPIRPFSHISCGAALRLACVGCQNRTAAFSP
jgi:hypothetical protein